MNHIVVYSGGMNSFTLLHYVLKQYVKTNHQIYALSFDYGQRHEREIVLAGMVCGDLGVHHKIINLRALAALTPGSALTGYVAVPHGHYAAENMKLTVVPGRNTLMLAFAMAFAEGLDGNSLVYYGAHYGDHAIYPDCRANFVNAMDNVMHCAIDGRVGLRAPFLFKDKAEILKEGDALGLTAGDYRMTYTCYAGGEKSCGKCGSCVERLMAFDDVGWIDPLDYEDRTSYRSHKT